MSDHEAPFETGTGWVNMTDDSSYKGEIRVYPGWVSFTTDSGSSSTVPAHRVEFINWTDE